MYKITLFDYNCASCTSGTASFYVDDIDIFEEKWSKLETSPERIERFRRSKNGEVVTDYYSDDEELNIYAMYLTPATKGDSVLLESKGHYLLIDLATSDHVPSIIKQLNEK